ncbi:MAG: GGDEF domain-containing protein [Lautropia sp.]
MQDDASPAELPAMIESIAGMTRSRDRHELDVALAYLIASCFRAEEIAIVKLHGAAQQRRARLSLRWRSGDRLPPLVREERDEDLLSIDAFPAGRAALASGEGWACVQAHPAPARCCAFVYRIDTEPAGWAQLVVDRVHPPALRELLGLIAIYGNHLTVIDAGERDTLTGLLNRRSFDVVFGRRLDALALEGARAPGERRERVSTHAAPRWLAVMDIDHFKRINDRFGHLYGDEVLVMIGQLMRRELRISDQVFRFGGEEFVVLLAPTPATQVHAVLDRLRESVAAHVFPQVGDVTVSIGYTCVCASDSPSDAFGRADDALYRAKDAGRNCTVAADPLDPATSEKARVLHSDADLF